MMAIGHDQEQSRYQQIKNRRNISRQSNATEKEHDMETAGCMVV